MIIFLSPHAKYEQVTDSSSLPSPSVLSYANHYTSMAKHGSPTSPRLSLYRTDGRYTLIGFRPRPVLPEIKVSSSPLTEPRRELPRRREDQEYSLRLPGEAIQDHCRLAGKVPVTRDNLSVAGRILRQDRDAHSPSA